MRIGWIKIILDLIWCLKKKMKNQNLHFMEILLSLPVIQLRIFHHLLVERTVL